MKKDDVLLKSEIEKEEALIVSILKGCRITTIKYDVLTFEMPMQSVIEPPKVSGYDYVKNKEEWLISRKGAKNPKLRRSTIEHITHYRTYPYKSKTTGNWVVTSDSSRTVVDRAGYPYTSFRVTFRSNTSNVTMKEIVHFLNTIMIYYESIRKEEFNLSPHEYKSVTSTKPFGLYYAEPCIDIAGTKASIDFLHKHFVASLYITRFSRRKSVKGNKSKVIKRKDGRLLDDINSTDYISDRVRCYRYKKGRQHYLRFEFRLDKHYMGNIGMQDIRQFGKQFNPSDLWRDRCYFFMFNIPKIKKHLSRKCPEQMNKVLSFLTEKQVGSDGKEISDWDKVVYLRRYRVNGKKLFKSSSEFLVKKWLTLHNLVFDSLKQVSVQTPPSYGIELRLPAPDQRPKPEDRIKKAVTELKQKGIKITYASIMRVSGIKSVNTVARHIHLKEGD